ncbi:MAG: DUF3667 domain-containing protein [Prevotella sp.]|nr:DUF3667 domain-containing protein [Prevotella sp.]
MSHIVEKWKVFCEWQRRPSHIPQMAEQHHRCYTCGQEYQGNYCPCCGQSARIGRYSFKNALLLFLDVWGMGNRGMFRTLRDLILRPGYLIRDYISGMQMAYFPPFKLLFLLTALLLIVDSGVNLKGENYLASYHEKTVNIDNSHTENSKKKEKTRMEQWNKTADMYIVKFREFRENNPAFFWLSLLFVLSFPLYLFFRKSPNIPDLRYSELLIALVYTWAMQDIYEIVLTFFCVYDDNVSEVTLLLCIIPLKQLSGFKWWRTSLYVILSYLAALALLLAAMLAAIEIIIFLEAM